MLDTPRKLSDPLRWRHVARITWRGTFPVDMLRYDRCSPLKAEDAVAIASSLDHTVLRSDGEQVIHVVKFDHRKDPVVVWTVHRWKSFGAQVEVRTEKCGVVAPQ